MLHRGLPPNGLNFIILSIYLMWLFIMRTWVAKKYSCCHGTLFFLLSWARLDMFSIACPSTIFNSFKPLPWRTSLLLKVLKRFAFARYHGKGTDGRRPLSPSRPPLRALFYRKRDAWVRGSWRTVRRPCLPSTVTMKKLSLKLNNLSEALCEGYSILYMSQALGVLVTHAMNHFTSFGIFMRQELQEAGETKSLHTFPTQIRLRVFPYFPLG